MDYNLANPHQRQNYEIQLPAWFLKMLGVGFTSKSAKMVIYIEFCESFSNWFYMCIVIYGWQCGSYYSNVYWSSSHTFLVVVLNSYHRWPSKGTCRRHFVQCLSGNPISGSGTYGSHILLSKLRDDICVHTSNSTLVVIINACMYTLKS